MSKRKRNSKEKTKKRMKKGVNGEWRMNGTILTFQSGRDLSSKSFSKVAAFDFDGTCIKTRSGKKFPTNSSDWELWYGGIPKKFQELVSKNYSIVLFSNQMGIQKRKTNPEDLKERINGFMLQVKDTVSLVYCATSDDRNRKPDIGMWEFFEKKFCQEVDLELEECFYCGDAAGRKKYASKALGGRKKRNDFSCSDRKFALNIGMKFFTPDELFFSEKSWPDWTLKGLDIRSLRKEFEIKKPHSPADYVKKDPEMIIMCGLPATGKSTFARKIFEKNGYVVINRDTLKSSQKCLNETKKCLQQGKSVVIDNTNADTSSREKYISIAMDNIVPVRCFVMCVKKDLAIHIGAYRSKLGGAKLAKVVFHTINKRFEKPRLEEGFKEIVEVQFVPEFPTKNEERLFYMYT